MASYQTPQKQGLSFLQGGSVKPKTNDKSAVKKHQSQIKTFVQSFGKLLQVWKHECEQIYILLQGLMELAQNTTAVISTAKKHEKDMMFLKFPDLGTKLIGGLLVDMESILSQLRLFERRLGDVHSAMVLLQRDTSKYLLTINPDHFTSDSIFNVDHLLEIQSIRSQHAREYERKSKLLHELLEINTNTNTNTNSKSKSKSSPSYMNILSLGASSNSNSEINSFYDFTASDIEERINKWPDDCDDSYIKIEEVAGYMLKNGTSV